MSDRDGFEPGVPCWVTAVEPDAEAAAAFYAELFGWETENLMPPDHPGSTSAAGCGGVTSRVSCRNTARHRRPRPCGRPTCGWRAPTRPPAGSSKPAAG